MAIHRFRDKAVSFDIGDATEVLGHEIRLIDNLGSIDEDGDGNINHLVGGLRRGTDGALTIYLDLPATGGGQ